MTGRAAEPRHRGFLGRLLASRAEIEAVDEQAVVHRRGGTPAAETHLRERAEVSGVLRAVTYRPQGAVPALVAEVYDGSGSIDLVWLGRRDVLGITPGRRIIASGMVCPGQRRHTIYNPTYELAPIGGE
jgi:hypothetical protein